MKNDAQAYNVYGSVCIFVYRLGVLLKYADVYRSWSMDLRPEALKPWVKL